MLPSARLTPASALSSALSSTLSSTLSSALARFGREEDGATLVEYVLLVALLAAVCAGTVTLLGANAAAKLNSASANLQ